MASNPDVTAITHQTYDKIAVEYVARIHNLFTGTWLADFERGKLDDFLEMIPSSPEIIDIGCGGGKDTAYLMTKKTLAMGVDYSSGMLHEAKRRFPECTFLQMDMRCLALGEGTLDGVWANGCVYHVPKSEFTTVLSEIHRVLKPSGVLSFNAKIGTGEVLDENPRSYGGSPRFYAYYSVDEMQDFLRRAGLETVKTIYYPEEIFGEKVFHLWARKR